MSLSQLFLPNRRAWDKRKIESIFTLPTVNKILNVPLFDGIDEDKLVWCDDALGNYSVKSGYNLLLHQTGKLNVLKEDGEWKRLWKLHAPPKTKHLLWRICKGCLPTRTRLHERFVNCTLLCPLCEQQNEDDWHILFGCNISLATWHEAGLDHVIMPRLRRYHNVKEVIMNICRVADELVAGKVAMMVWMLWNNRNNCVWNDTREAGRELGIKAMIMWNEWHDVQGWRDRTAANLQNQQHSRPLGQERASSAEQGWQKPAVGWLKCNVDAGFHNTVGKTSGGWCMRNHLGHFVAAGTSWIHGHCSIVEGEAAALLEAMNMLALRGARNVIFEIDSKSVADAISSARSGESELSSILCNIRSILSLPYNFKVKFVRRQANMAAHQLARAAIS